MGDVRCSSIGELCDAGGASLQTGPFGSQLHASDYVEDGVPVVPTEALVDGRIDHDLLPMITTGKARELSRHELSAGDIVFARRGVQATGRTSRIGRAEDGFIGGTGIIRLRIHAERAPVTPDFMAWVLRSPDSVAWLKHHAIGATMPNLNEGIIRTVPVPLVPIREQHRIAGILSAFDDKIELNRRMATTLEGLARAAYAELQASLSDECSAGSIADVAFNPRDQVDPRQVDPSTPYIGLEHVPRGRLVLGEWGQAVNAESGKLAFQRNDILFGKLRPYFRKVGVVPTSGICSTDIIVIRARRPEDLGYVLAVATDAAFIEASNAASTGTRMPRTSWSDLLRYQLLIPPMSARAAFTKRVWPLIERAQAAASENSTLEQVRDTLLPRLLSGDIELAT